MLQLCKVRFSRLPIFLRLLSCLIGLLLLGEKRSEEPYSPRDRSLLQSVAAQMAKHIFSVPKVVVRVYDPFRGEIFGKLGLRTFSPTNISAEMAYDALIRDA